MPYLAHSQESLNPAAVSLRGDGSGKTRSRRLALITLAAFSVVNAPPQIPAAAAALREVTLPALSALYFPPADGSWESLNPEEVGWRKDRLEELLEWAGRHATSDLVIALGGKLLAERHFEVGSPGERYAGRYLVGGTRDGRPIEDIASMQKSVLVFFVGAARARGLLDFDDPVSRHLGPGWSKLLAEHEQEITLRHLMSMTSGLSGRGEHEDPAGARWRYNNYAYTRLFLVLEKVFGASVEGYTRDLLTEPLGMRDSAWQKRSWATGGGSANPWGFMTTAHDLARFGILVLAGGKWNGKDLLGDSDFFEGAFTPSQELNPAYGLLWWLNGQDAGLGFDGKPHGGPLLPAAPDDLAAARGALERGLYVAPSLGLVVARLGDDPGPGFAEELWRRIMEAAPRSTD